MNQGKLKVIKQKMARVNIDILGIRELIHRIVLIHRIKLIEWLNLIQMTIISTTEGKNPLKEIE